MSTRQLIEQIKNQAVRLESAKDLDVLLEAIGDAPYVLLGEASHGTSEFYTWRAEISKRLIEEKGFSFIAVEGDWPSCYQVNRYSKQYPDAAGTGREAVQEFKRWPTWMWANREIIELAEWMRNHNEKRPDGQKVGFYGLDVYSLWESMEEIIHHLEKTGAKELELAKKAFSCFEPFERDEQTYGMSAAYFSSTCEDEVVQLLKELQEKRQKYDQDSEASLSAELNALVAVNAERYYRSMVRGGPDSWNIRDHHMVEVLNRLMKFHGSGAKAIVWEHNTHIGDARATDMRRAGMVNVGQLVREQQGEENVFAVGFGTHRGTVIAGREWAAPMEVMKVPSAEAGSWEDAMHKAGDYDQILIFDQNQPVFEQTIGHRAIGVVYHPENEWGNYVPSQMSRRYDAFVYIDETKALEPVVVEEVFA
ncbi:erythromycin esterase family protein [Brevibacillus dissolubilis]|uniref:erythromycin esterase family protein n=1 Tax=Brevibacillus dissolubilis TaxID=1844116 RepID=UPI001117ADE0|nr:erythromycin esterase family protein [Brevibacillus dissolubilis]